MSDADPKAGHLLPVLDLETNEGLDQQEMTQWAGRWVEEVRRLTGVTPLVYTSPYGWGAARRHPSLAREGAPLWVAHWGVPSPTTARRATGTEDGGSGSTRAPATSPASRATWTSTSRGNSLGRITIRRLTVEVPAEPAGSPLAGRPRLPRDVRPQRRPGRDSHTRRPA